MQFIDINGAAKVKMVPVSHFDDVIDEGAGFAGAAVMGLGQGPHSHDMLARVDLDTYTVIPWDQGIVRFAADLFVDDEPYMFDPRQHLKKTLKDLESQRIKEREGQILSEREEQKAKEEELRLKEQQQKTKEREEWARKKQQAAEEEEQKLIEEELKLKKEEEQRELEAKIEEEKRIKEEEERLRQWEIKFDEEQKKREEELIRKFYKNNEKDRTNIGYFIILGELRYIYWITIFSDK